MLIWQPWSRTVGICAVRATMEILPSGRTFESVWSASRSTGISKTSTPSCSYLVKPSLQERLLSQSYQLPCSQIDLQLDKGKGCHTPFERGWDARLHYSKVCKSMASAMPDLCLSSQPQSVTACCLYQIVLLGDRGTRVRTTCPELLCSRNPNQKWTRDLLIASMMPSPLHHYCIWCSEEGTGRQPSTAC